MHVIYLYIYIYIHISVFVYVQLPPQPSTFESATLAQQLAKQQQQLAQNTVCVIHAYVSNIYIYNCHRGAGPSISTTPKATTRNPPGHGPTCGNPEQHRPAQSGHDCSGAHCRLSSLFKHHALLQMQQEGSSVREPSGFLRHRRVVPMGAGRPG